MTPRIGSLCTGYGGLDMAVRHVYGGRILWCSENDRHASTVLATRFPGVPNIGDLTVADWAGLPPVDILTAGYPCQPFSDSGLKQGDNDPRHLWPHIRTAVRVLRPRITVLENVSHHRWRGFGSVLRDCAEDGLDVRWVSVRASDVGAPHRRERLFFTVTHPDGARSQRWQLRPCHRYEPTGERRDQAGHNTRIDWGRYESAIRRWERIMQRAAPDIAELNKLGRPRLTARFHEWMLGLPDGWVTDVDIPYKGKIQLTGNGVMPQQAVLALQRLEAA